MSIYRLSTQSEVNSMLTLLNLSLSFILCQVFMGLPYIHNTTLYMILMRLCSIEGKWMAREIG